MLMADTTQGAMSVTTLIRYLGMTFGLFPDEQPLPSGGHAWVTYVFAIAAVIERRAPEPGGDAVSCRSHHLGPLPRSRSRPGSFADAIRTALPSLSEGPM